MTDEGLGWIELYRTYKSFSPDHRRKCRENVAALAGKAGEYLGRSIKSSLKKTALGGLCTLALVGPVVALAHGISQLEPLPTTAWSSRSYEGDDGSTELERKYYPAKGHLCFGRIRYVDRNSDGLDLEDDIYMAGWRTALKRKATERDIRIFGEEMRALEGENE